MAKEAKRPKGHKRPHKAKTAAAASIPAGTGKSRHRQAHGGPTGPGGPGRRPKVWHITRFEERFEMPVDAKICRKSALIFTRDFVAGGDDEAMAYHRQIRTLESYENHLELLGAFHWFKRAAANLGRAYRGYLLDEFFQPASDTMIAGWLRIDVKSAKRILTALAAVRLIERVDLPAFDPGDNEPPESGNAKGGKRPKAQAKGARALPRRSTRRKGPAGRLRKGSQNCAKLHSSEQPFTREKRSTTRTLTATAIKKKKKKTAAPFSKKKNAKAKPGPPASPADETEAQDPKIIVHRKGGGIVEVEYQDDRTTPTTHPPNMPTEADARGGRAIARASRNDGPPASDHTDVTKLEREYSRAARDFAIEIYIALRLPYAHDSPEAARELCSLAAAWQAAEQSGLSPASCTELWKRSVREAKAIAKKPASTFRKSPSAVWRWIYNRRLGARTASQAAAG